MTGVDIGPEGFVVDAGILARAFGLEPTQVRDLMRRGAITSQSEAGIDTDAGQHRLTFWHGGRALRLVVDDAGQVLSQATFASHPPRARQP